MIDLEKVIADGFNKDDPEHEWNDQRVHISDLAVGLDDKSDRKCRLQLWLRYNNYHKKNKNNGTKLMFKQGNNLHEILADLIKKGLPDNWEVVGVEKQISIDFITGRYDCQIINKTTGKKYIIDFKTVRGAAFNYLNKPKGSHILQVQSYMLAENADGGFVIYADREGQNFVKQFEVKRNDEKVKKSIEIAKNITYSEIAPKILSPKIRINENKGNNSVVADLRWQCKYCDFRGVSCEGSIPEEYEDNLGKVVGHLDSEGNFIEKIEGIKEYIKEVI